MVILVSWLFVGIAIVIGVSLVGIIANVFPELRAGLEDIQGGRSRLAGHVME